MGLPYRAKTIALFFLEMGDRDNIEISPMKMQRLIYFAHGWCLAITDSPLIEESIEAWRYGSVVSNIYYWLRSFGSQPINLKKLEVEPHDLARLENLKHHEQIVHLLHKVWEVYKDYDAITLSEMAYLPASPWDLTRKEVADEKFNVTIDDNQIKHYFIAQSGKSQIGAINQQVAL